MRLWFAGILLIFFIGGCSKGSIGPDKIVFPKDDQTFERLSDYCLFEKPMADLVPNKGLVPYDLNSALFTDYASKKRFVYVPEGSSAPYPSDSSAVLDFPVGSILVKNFYYTLPDQSEKIIETRLLLRRDSGWVSEVYKWKEDQSDAERIIAGEVIPLSFLVDGVEKSAIYLIPTQNQCKNCHSTNDKIIPIGPRLGNLNKDYAYEEGTSNQIEKWASLSLLASLPQSSHPRWPDYRDTTVDLSLRARAYLDINCAHCHGYEGAANNSGLNLGYHNLDSLSYGFYKSPVAAGNGSGGLSYDILPGSADSSILMYRMLSVEVDERMPELGRSLVDEEGIELIREWIDSM